MYKELCDLGEIADAMKIKYYICAVDNELIHIEKKLIKLETIDYNGTVSEWAGIELGKDWNAAVATKVVHCTDGDVEITIEE